MNSKECRRSTMGFCVMLLIVMLLSAPAFASNAPASDVNSLDSLPGKFNSAKGEDLKTGDRVKMINEPVISKHDPHGFLEAYFQRTSDTTGFAHGFVASFAVIIVSEIADKTFFIAAIMAMRHSRAIVFMGAISALAFMTVLSGILFYSRSAFDSTDIKRRVTILFLVFLGYATTVIPRVYTFYASTALFAVFGIRMLREGYYMSRDEGHEELEEVQLDLKRRDDEFERKMQEQQKAGSDIEAGMARTIASKKMKLTIHSHVFLEALTLTFLAEWGDRSQLATIILGARENAYGVSFGGILGHSICTAMAVVGGRFIATKISPRTVTLVGGTVFLLFALSALIMGPGVDAV